MAGGFGVKPDPKNNKYNKSGFNNEIFKSQSEYSSSQSTDKSPKFSLKGILNLGQTVEVNNTPKKVESTWNKEFFGPSHLQKEQELLIQKEQEELKKSIDALREEIQKLVKSAENLDENIEIIAMEPVTEVNEYQVNVLQRLKRLIVNFTLNINQAGIWLDCARKKKQKHNAFWGNVKNKKSGGEQYLFSSEHTASRSAN